MVAAMFFSVFSAFIFSAFLTFISATDRVPVLIWQLNGQNPLPSASAGDHLSAKQFQTDVIDKLSSNGTVIIFMQDSLSQEDFALYGNAYGLKSSKSAYTNLQKLLQSYPSTLFPSVEAPKESIAAFSRNGRKIVSKSNEAELSTTDSDKIIIFDLLATASSTDRQQSLQKNDQFIGRVMKRAKNLFPSIIAVYTAAKSSWIHSDDGGRMAQMSRRILATPSDDAGNYTGIFMHYENCFLMYAKNLTLKVTYQSTSDSNVLFTNSSQVPLDELNIDVNASSCENNTATILFNYKNIVTSEWLQTLQFTFNFTRSRTGEWSLVLVNTAYHAGESGESNLRTSDAWAPIGLSWNCGTARFMDLNHTYPKAELEFNKLQFQVFDVKNGAFGDAYDCIGFFTVGIWMSIFSSIILIAILACGISMVMSINTMDRFDDPKGKTITVSATD